MLLSFVIIIAALAPAHAQVAPRGQAPATRPGDPVVVTGRVVTDSTGDPVRNARVTSSRYPRRSAAGNDGVFTITGLPAGSYFVSAVTAVTAGDDARQDLVFLESLIAGASTIGVADRQKAALILRVHPR